MGTAREMPPTERAIPGGSPASAGAQARVLARRRVGVCGAGRGEGDGLALPPAPLPRQLLVHGEKRHGELGDEQAADGDQTWDVAKSLI